MQTFCGLPIGESMTDIDGLRRILTENTTIAVVGLSANWWRPSFFAAKYMQDHGYRIIPVNPNYDEILGEKCYDRIEDIPDPVDVVDIFQRPEVTPALAQSAVAIGAGVLWMQIGVVNDESARIAESGGLEVVMNRCVKIEHARLLGGLNLIGVNTGVISSRRPRRLIY
jgi:predicted CoA-binding protein